MGVTRVLLEAGLLTTSVNAAIFAWMQPFATDWAEVFLVLAQALSLSFCCVLSFYYNDLYDLRIVRSFGDFASRLVQAFGVAFILMAVFWALLPGIRISNGPLLLSVLAILGVLLPLRVLFYGLMRQRSFLEHVLILGTGPLASKILGEIEARPYLGYEIVGIADNASAPGHAPCAYPLLGPLEHLDKIVEKTHPHRIILALSERRARLPVRQLLDARMNGCTVEDGVDAYERLTGKVAIESLTPSNVIFSREFKKSRLDLAVGRLASLLVSVVGLIASAPLLGLITLAIRLESKGPLFFVQERLGLRSKRFRLVKFRTMRVAEADCPTSEWAQDNTERITRVGKWLRTFRLDELPQFVNVIRGDMNLVGPRPHPVSNRELFWEGIPYYALRSAVRPGITGWAQVRFGYANNLEEETEKMRYDLYYIKHLSFWLDLRILFDTVKIVLFGRGAQSADAYPAQGAMGVSGR
jgi:exopolysaccharide biosynthesis polyprenyl glycosylphosphotransferase